MQPISERARRLIEEFKKGLAALPMEERSEAARRATETLTALHADARSLFDTLQDEMVRTRGEEKPNSADDVDIENVSDYK